MRWGPKPDRPSINRSSSAKLVESYEPCADSPFPAVCRYALEFPLVTFDEEMSYEFGSGNGIDYRKSTGQSLE